jgi:molybdopterin synthase catalytic subunit
VTFTGVCRAHEGGAPLVAMTLEHYPGMAEAEVGRHVDAAERRWPLLGVTVIHRYGRLVPGEEIVLVVTAAAHRQDAFAAAEFLMDYLKTRAPFWKQVEYADRAQWVDAKSSDDALADRWKRPGGEREAAE